ncbi:hypothetical protein STEG23_026551, partial [Scotinomys teguina]
MGVMDVNLSSVPVFPISIFSSPADDEMLATPRHRRVSFERYVDDYVVLTQDYTRIRKRENHNMYDAAVPYTLRLVALCPGSVHTAVSLTDDTAFLHLSHIVIHNLTLNKKFPKLCALKSLSKEPFVLLTLMHEDEKLDVGVT